MFEGFSSKTLDFMWGLRLNNNKPWFDEHKDEYRRDFLGPMYELGRDVFGRVTEAYGNRGFKHKLSRIYKDTRRIHSDGPYRANMWFTIERPSEEWTNVPVFWFELGPDEWSYGMGYYQAKPQTMAKLRARIDKNPRKFEEFISPLERQNEFVLEGEEYKRARIARTEKVVFWYNVKSFSIIHRQENDAELFSRALPNRLFEGFRFLMPFYDYFITLDSDPAPDK